MALKGFPLWESQNARPRVLWGVRGVGTRGPGTVDRGLGHRDGAGGARGRAPFARGRFPLVPASPSAPANRLSPCCTMRRRKRERGSAQHSSGMGVLVWRVRVVDGGGPWLVALLASVGGRAGPSTAEGVACAGTSGLVSEFTAPGTPPAGL
jgi:hypothetical protein